MDDKLIENIAFIIKNFIEKQESSNFDSLLYYIIDYIIKKMNLQDYVNKVNISDFYDRNRSSRGVYTKDNNLFIFREPIEKDISEMLQKAPYFSDFEIFMLKIISYVKTIIHELQHVKQRKLLAEDTQNNSFETLITRLMQEQSHWGRGVKYFISYDSHPAERLAEIHSYRSIIKILEIFGSEIEKLTKFFKKKSIFEEFYNYYKYGLSGPTIACIDFFVDKDKILILKQKILNNDLNLFDRLLYGFKITEDEYKGLVMQYCDLRKELENFSNKKLK